MTTSITDEEAKNYLKEFFEILEIEEESDSGHLFHPTYISCARVLTTEKLQPLLTKLKEWCTL